MKAWAWIAVGVIWAIGIAVLFRTSGFAVGVKTSKWITPKDAFALAQAIMRFISWGWLLPLGIGGVKLIRASSWR